MAYIPTAAEPEKLKSVYKANYGESSYDYQNNLYDWLEYRLLNDAHRKKFGNIVGNMCLACTLAELNVKIRKSLESGVPYNDGVPKGNLI